MNRWTLVLALVLCACGASDLPLPSIVSIAPQGMAASESILLSVELNGAMPFTVDYGKKSADLLTNARVRIADQSFEVLRVEEKGQRLIARIPPGLPVGQQDIRVEFEDGRQQVLPASFMVRPPLDITSLAINFIPTQVRHRPFTITIRALGPDAELFQGVVKLSISRGTVTPTESGPFNQGVRLQEVIVDDTGGSNLAITAEDYAGHAVTSNDFRLLPN